MTLNKGVRDSTSLNSHVTKDLAWALGFGFSLL